LFAFHADNDPDHSLFTIDTATGAGTLVGNTGLSLASGNGMAFGPGGMLFHSQFPGGTLDLNTLDTATGAPTFQMVLNLDYTPTNNGGRLSAMDRRPGDGRMYGISNDGMSGGGPQYLVRINLNNGNVTTIGQTQDGMDGMAWGPAATGLPPELVHAIEEFYFSGNCTAVPAGRGGDAVGALVLMVPLAGAWVFRRRRRRRA